jgi:ABC-type antimicrobial peptide transport system permease subunit
MLPEIHIAPPRLAKRLFRWYCRPDRLEELEGDLEEFFYLRLNDGAPVWKARLYFWWNVLRCYQTYAKSKTQKKSIMLSLFKSYFKLALRHSWKNRGPVTINVVGLGLALSMCVFVYMLFAYNMEFDSLYKNTDSTYRLHAMMMENGRLERNEISPIALEDKLRNEISGINNVSSYFTRNVTIKKGSDFFSEYGGVVSADFFDMFEIPLWYGSFAEFGEQPIIYLTPSSAKKYFGDEVALGEKLVVYLSNDKKIEMTVGGVFEKTPLNNSFDFNYLISQNDYVRIMDIDPNDWSVERYMGHYVNISPSQKDQITAEINRNLEVYNKSNKTLKIQEFELTPFKDPIHADHIIDSKYTNARLRPQVMIIFGTLTLMVFLTACFNLANTSMALIARRLKEIGIRKTLGSGSRQILIQFLFEMGIVSFLAFIIAVSTANYTAKAIMGLFGAQFLIQDVSLTGVILFIIGFLIFTTLIAGLLPALYAWKFQPVAIMRKAVKLRGIGWLTKSLTVAQYSFSIAVLIAGITFSQNSDFLDDFNLGYQNDRIFHIPVENEYLGQIKQQVNQIPGVITTETVNHFGNFGRYSDRAELKIDTSSHEVRKYAIGENYLDVMEVSVTSGRGFIKGSTAEENTILVSQSFAERFLEGDPINQVVKIDDDRKTIVGVFADVIDDVYEDMELKPTIITLAKQEDFGHLIVKVSHDDLVQVEDQLKIIWSENIDKPYTGELQKDFALGQAGRDTKNLQKIFLTMAILSGFLSIVGIFSLAKLNVAKRVKEISIRKVLGASLKELLFSINRSFAIILLIAMAVGCGLGYLISDAVLSMIYKYHVEASMITSLTSGLFVVLVSVIMLSGVALVPANSNPVNGLRDE